MNYVLLVIGWIVYYTGHSVFASTFIKDRINLDQRNYRLIYTLLSTVGLLALLIFNAWIGGEFLFTKTGVITYLSLLLAGGGVMIIRAAFRNYSIRSFIGLKKEKDVRLKTDGINRYVRHPLYSGTILITMGYFLFDPRMASLITVLITWLYLWIGIRLEERKLIDAYGDEYREYQQQVAAIIPFVL